MEYEILKRYHPIFWVGLMGIVTYLVALILLYATSFRNALYLEFLFLFITLSILGFISKYDKKIWKKAIIYFIAGLSWEVLTEANWTYTNNLIPMIHIYNDIPIAMLFYWVSTFSLAFLFFSRISGKFNRLFAQIITIFSLFLVAESIGFNILKIWNYNFNHIFLIPPYFLPPHIFIGYLIFGNLFLIFMRKKLYNPPYLINFILELIENPLRVIKDLG